MKILLCMLFSFITVMAQAQSLLEPQIEMKPIARRTGACNYNEFLDQALKLHAYRTHRLLSEKQFVKMAAEQGTIIVDARGKEAYRECHVAGSVNVPFTDFTAENLKRHIPTKNTKILIYCRNNIEDAAAQRISDSLPFVEPKTALTGLNIPTFITLVSYGYDNIYELDDIVDPRTSIIQFEFSGEP